MKIKTLTIALTLLLALSAGAQTATVKGILRNAPGESVYLNRAEGRSLIAIDTALVDAKGNFAFTVKTDKEQFLLLNTAKHKDAVVYLMIEPKDKITIELEYDSDIDYMRLLSGKGSKNIEVYHLFNEELYKSLTDYKKVKLELANPAISQARKQELNAQTQQMQNSRNEAIEKLLSQHSNVLISAFLVTYFEERSTDYIKLYESIANGLKKKYPDNEFVKNVVHKVETTIVPGGMAPEIAMKDPTGKERKLSDLRGKVVLIDFWASWCGPCRMENPNVVRLYKKYHDKGFDIYSVSLDKTRDKWLEAIQRDGLEWDNHVSDLNGWTSTGGATYGITSIPATVLVDREGRVIARNLRGPDLAKKLQEIFGE